MFDYRALSLSSSNKFIVRIYSDYLNNQNISQTRLKDEIEKIEAWLGRATALCDRVDNWIRNCFEESIGKPMRAGKFLLKGLLPLYDHQLHNFEGTPTAQYRPSRVQLSRCLKDTIELVNCGLEYGQAMAFFDWPIGEVYKQQITSAPRFGFLMSESGSLHVFLDFVFPFHHDKFDSSKQCLKAAELPPFFQKSNQSTALSEKPI